MLHCQRTTLFSMDWHEPAMSNPAYYGLDGQTHLLFTLHQQWDGLEKSPQWQRLGGHIPIHTINGGAGIFLTRDALGLEKKTALAAGYNQIWFTQDLSISAGLALRWNWDDLDEESIRTPDGIYQNGRDHQDPVLVDAFSQSTLGLDLGIVVRTHQSAFSVSMLSLPLIRVGKVNLWPNQRFLQGRIHHRFTISDKWSISPTAGLKTDFSQYQFALFSEIDHSGKIFGTMGFAGWKDMWTELFHVSLGVNLNKSWSIVYSYQRHFNISDLGNVHGLGLFYTLDGKLFKRKLPAIEYNGRWMR